MPMFWGRSVPRRIVSKPNNEMMRVDDHLVDRLIVIGQRQDHCLLMADTVIPGAEPFTHPAVTKSVK